MRMIWIAAVLAAFPAAAWAQERPPETEAGQDLLYRDGALIYGPGYDEAYRAGLDAGYETGFDDGRHAEAEARAPERRPETDGVRTTVTTAGYGDGRTRFTEVPRGEAVRAADKRTARKRRR